MLLCLFPAVVCRRAVLPCRSILSLIAICGNLGVLHILRVYHKRGHGHPCTCSTMNQIDRAQPHGQSSNSGRIRPRGPPLLCLRYAVQSALANALTSSDTTKLERDASPSPRPCSPVGIEMTNTARRKLPATGHCILVD